MIKNTKLLELLKNGNLEELETALYKNIVEENNKAAGKSQKDTTIFIKLYKKCSKETNTRLKKMNKFIVNNIEYFGLTEFFRITENINNSLTYDIKKLKYFIKQCKQNKKDCFYTVFIENDYMISFDANLLVDCLEYCNTDTIQFYKNGSKQITPCFIQSENKKKTALLLPVYTTKENNIKDFMFNMLKGYEE